MLTYWILRGLLETAIKRSTKWMLWLGIILSYVVIGYVAILFFFGTIYTLPMELIVLVLVPFIIAMTAGMFPLDLEDKLDEDPRAGGKILVCGIGVFIAAFWVVIFVFWLGSQNLLAFLPMYLFVLTVLFPNMVLFFLIGGLFFTAGYRIRFAPISSEPVPPLPNRNRIIAILGTGILCMIIALVIQPYLITYVFIEILFYGWFILLLTGGALGFIAVVMYDFASKNRYDESQLKEIPEDRFLCPLCHTEIDPRSYRCIHCNHIIPNGIKPNQ